MLDRPAIIDLRDQTQSYAWDRLAIRHFLALAGIVVDEEERSFRSFEPPRVVLAIVPRNADSAWMLERARPWLRRCEHVVVLREHDPIEEDPELDALVEEAWAPVLAGLPASEVLDARPLDADIAREAVRRALAACTRLPARPPAPIVAVAAAPELPVSSWCAYTTQEKYYQGDLACFAWRLAGTSLALVDGAQAELAALPAHLALQDPPRRPRNAPMTLPGAHALGRDPTHPIGWRGDRMHFYWTVFPGGEESFLCACDHDFPCGPGKKLYGFKDNDPVQIVLAPDASLCAARFDHDVLVTSAVPMAWTRAGEVDVAVFPRDLRRALFFAQDENDPGARDDSTGLLDEDARDVAPIVVLGPDEGARYAIDLALSVHRITRPAEEPQIAHVGGPGEGFAVFDADHRLVRRGSGRLLGGWFRWATIEEDGQYWREDLATGERTRVAPVDLVTAEDPEVESVARDAILEGRLDVALTIHGENPSRSVGEKIGVVAVPGTKNVLLVSETHLRIV